MPGIRRRDKQQRCKEPHPARVRKSHHAHPDQQLQHGSRYNGNFPGSSSLDEAGNGAGNKCRKQPADECENFCAGRNVLHISFLFFDRLRKSNVRRERRAGHRYADRNEKSAGDNANDNCKDVFHECRFRGFRVGPSRKLSGASRTYLIKFVKPVSRSLCL